MLFSVAHVSIQSKTVNESQIYYDIHYNETFKPHPPKNPHIIIPIPLPNQLVSQDNSAACGVDGLQVGEEYLIAGNRQNLSLSINSCLTFSSSNNETGKTYKAFT
jgi:hypothetical protein